MKILPVWSLGVLLSAAASSQILLAHDIGITQVELLETAAADYRLSAKTGPVEAYLHLTPTLPGHCEFSGSPRGVQSPESLTWQFSCSPRLSADDVLLLPWRRDGAMIVSRWLDGTGGRRLFGNVAGVITVSLSELQAGSGSTGAAVRRYTVLGVEHILEGIDHLLFVLGLLLIVVGPVMLIKTITAFTAAHSLTLGLATLGFVSLPSGPVEAAIALSIVFLAMEAIRGWRGQRSLTHRQPWLVAFGFGLLHGLGFAGALADVGLPQAEIPLGLLFFNVGVEIGQLLFVALVLGVRWLLSLKPGHWPLWAEYAPAYLIGTVGAYWMIERVSGFVLPM